MFFRKSQKYGELSRATWEKLAGEDAEFYILTAQDKRGGKWNKEEFLKTGQDQWERFKKLLSHYGLQRVISQEKIALDVGCGVGRITFAMAQDFFKVIGVDVSPTMIKKAKEYHQNLPVTNIEFQTGNGLDLSSCGNDSIDLVFSYITLQHCPSSGQVLHYIEEFSRVLRSGGVCLFQTRVAPTFQRYLKSLISKKIRKIKNFSDPDPHLSEKAFVGNWIRLSAIQKVLSRNFSAFYLLVSPFEVYQESFWQMKDDDARWKRTFVIAVK